MSTVNYMATGFVLDTENDQNYRTGYFALFNPNKRNARVVITFFYEDQEPTQLKNYVVPAECQKVIEWDKLSEIVKNKRWGAKVESGEPLVAQESHHVRKRGDKPEFVRSQCTTMMTPILTTLWYYADGVYIMPRDHVHRRMFEPEMVGLLNPNRREAEVTMITYHTNRNRREATFKLPPERSKWVDLVDVVGKDPPHFGARFISTEPVVVQQERQVYAVPGSPVQRSDFNEIAVPGPMHDIDTLREMPYLGAYNIGYFPGPDSLLVVFNPTRHDTVVDVTLYYEKENPNLYSFGLKAETSLAIFDLLNRQPPVIKAEPWGCKVVSTEPVIIQDLCGSGDPVSGGISNYRWGKGLPPKARKLKHSLDALGTYEEELTNHITWNMASRQAATTLAKVWCYADGMVRKPPTEYSKKLYTPEWAFILNPTKRDSEVTVTLYYEDQTRGEHKLTLPAQRIKGLEMEKIVIPNKSYGADFVSTEPIVVSHNKGFFNMDDPVQRDVQATMAMPLLYPIFR